MEAIEIISAFALSLSFILLIWTIKGFLLKPTATKSTTKVTIVINADEKTKNLDREVERLFWLREEGLLVADIIVVDTGMNGETAQIADSLLHNNPSLQICRPEELAKIITRGIVNGAEG